VRVFERNEVRLHLPKVGVEHTGETETLGDSGLVHLYQIVQVLGLGGLQRKRGLADVRELDVVVHKNLITIFKRILHLQLGVIGLDDDIGLRATGLDRDLLHDTPASLTALQVIGQSFHGQTGEPGGTSVHASHKCYPLEAVLFLALPSDAFQNLFHKTGAFSMILFLITVSGSLVVPDDALGVIELPQPPRLRDLLQIRHIQIGHHLPGNPT